MKRETKASDTSGSPVVDGMLRSKLYRDYRRAFTRATGLPLELHAPDEMKVHRPATVKAAPFCTLMAKANASCAACYALQMELEEKAQLEAKTIKCFAGLCETEVPVRVGENVIAFLHTGHILLDRPDKAHFNQVAEELIRWGTHVDLKQAEEAYFATRVISQPHYKSLVQLLAIFAEHLATSGGQLTLRQNRSEPSSVSRARKIIDLQSQDEVSLGQVAKLVNVSANYFSELFHKTTGIRFVDYVARVRIEKAKTMLSDSRARISEVAYDVGFKSLSQFNRAFKKFAGVAPKGYRARSGGAA
jgi:AraC-like DNA-binding protein/ligand-binding sensor protein